MWKEKIDDDDDDSIVSHKTTTQSGFNILCIIALSMAQWKAMKIDRQKEKKKETLNLDWNPQQ